MDLQQSAHTRSFRPDDEAFGWDDVEVLAYKDEGSAPFRGITPAFCPSPWVFYLV